MIGFEPWPLHCQLQLPNRRKIFAIYAPCLLMYAVATPDLDPNPRGGGQLPDPDPNPSGWGQLPYPKSAILC